MNHLRQLLLAFLLLGILVTSLIQTVVHAADVSVKLPLIDAPFNWSNGYSFPSMQQSLGLSKGLYDYTHQQIAQIAIDRGITATISGATVWRWTRCIPVR